MLVADTHSPEQQIEPGSGVRYSVRQLERIGAKPQFSCEGHPPNFNGWYVDFAPTPTPRSVLPTQVISRSSLAKTGTVAVSRHGRFERTAINGKPVLAADFQRVLAADKTCSCRPGLQVPPLGFRCRQETVF